MPVGIRRGASGGGGGCMDDRGFCLRKLSSASSSRGVLAICSKPDCLNADFLSGSVFVL